MGAAALFLGPNRDIVAINSYRREPLLGTGLMGYVGLRLLGTGLVGYVRFRFSSDVGSMPRFEFAPPLGHSLSFELRHRHRLRIRLFIRVGRPGSPALMMTLTLILNVHHDYSPDCMFHQHQTEQP